VLHELNQPVSVRSGSFRLSGSQREFEGELFFRWTPSPMLAFRGTSVEGRVDTGPALLQSDGPQPVHAHIFVTEVSHGATGCAIRGVLDGPVGQGDEPFETLRFSLANFPEYRGDPIRHEIGGGRGLTSGRLRLVASSGTCCIDSIPEVRDLRKTARQEGGFVLSHVGEWRPSAGSLTVEEALSSLEMLHFWFGLLCGAWAGPLFPQGLSGETVAWQHFAGWHLGDSRAVRTWLPDKTKLELDQLFEGFLARWGDPRWRAPLRTAIAWYVEANAPETAAEARVILSQVALDLLAWVHVVETQHLVSRGAFDDLGTAGRIRSLLERTGVPVAAPAHMDLLSALCGELGTDGPGIIAKARNAVVHSKEGSRRFLEAMDAATWFECCELALSYLELALLSVCQHNGHYARRGYGGAELLVPWVPVE
jgi:hypothetical protein